MKKNNHGGKRTGAGRTAKYNEPTTTIAIRVPVSETKEVKKVVKEYLNKLRVKFGSVGEVG